MSSGHCINTNFHNPPVDRESKYCPRFPVDGTEIEAETLIKGCRRDE